MGIMLGLGVPVILFEVVSMKRQREFMEQELDGFLTFVSVTLASGLAEPIWNLTHTAGAPLINTISADPRVISIEVVSEIDGKIFDVVSQAKQVGKVVSRVVPIRHGSEKIGQVTVKVSTDTLDEVLNLQLREVFMLAALQFVMSVMFVTLIVNRKLVRPLGVLVNQVNDLAKKNLEQRFEWQGDDEICQLGKGLEETRLALSALFESIENKNDELALVNEALLEESQTIRELQQRAEILLDTTKKLASEWNEVSVLKEAGRVLVRTFALTGTRRFTAYLLRDDGTELHTRVEFEVERFEDGRQEGIGEVAIRNVPVTEIGKVSFFESAQAWRKGSILQIPLVYKEEKIGLLRVPFPEYKNYTLSDEHFIEMFSQSLAMSLQNLAHLETISKTQKAVHDARLAELGRVAVRIGDRMGSPLNIVELTLEDIEDIVGEAISNPRLLEEFGEGVARVRRAINSIKIEIFNMRKFRTFAPTDSLVHDFETLLVDRKGPKAS
jgi:hypothetical protein